MPLKRVIPVVLAISLLGAGLSFGLAGASPETDSDPEYDAAVASDSSGAKETDEFVKIEKSVEKPLMNKQTAKAARSVAMESVAGLEPHDQNWTAKSPKLFGKPVPFYLDDGEPFAYEWKIRCGENPDCGSITVATLENEYRVIETATSGKANYERLGSGKASKSNRFYYYSAVEKFAQSTDVSGTEVTAVDPGKKADPNLASELAGKKAELRDYRKSGKLRFEKTQSSVGDLYATGTIVNVPGSGLGSCGGPLPCYNQFTTTYNGATCASGCAPTALAIIFGYYDRNGAFPNLLPGVVASDTAVDQPMVKSIASYMQTVCVGNGGATNITNYPLGMQYARNKGYTNAGNGTVLTGNVATMVGRLQTEIQAGKPVMVHYYVNANGRQEAHVMAAYGYRTNAYPTPTDIHVNFGWGGAYPDAYIPSSGIVTQTQAGIGNPVAGMGLGGVITVPMQ